MKVLLILILVFSLSACKKQETFTLTGRIQGLQEGMVYLQDRVAGLMVVVDSAIIENGRFRFEGQLEFPEIYYFRIDGIRPVFTVFLENASILLEIDPDNPTDYQVSGSRSHDIFTGINPVIAIYDEQLRTLQQNIISAEITEDTESADRLREEHKLAEEQRMQKIKEYIAQHPDEHAAVFIAMRQLAHNLNAKELSEVVALFSPSLEGARYYDDLKTRVAVLERVAIGNPAIDFTLMDPEENQISLTDFSGKYVLINFWASWCPYCREENPHLVKLYNKLPKENFVILGVSLDRTHEAWVKAIAEDGLLWPQVSDLKGWNSVPAGDYAVRVIPQNVLIDPQGTIIGRNLKGKELEETLERLLQPI